MKTDLASDGTSTLLEPRLLGIIEIKTEPRLTLVVNAKKLHLQPFQKIDNDLRMKTITFLFQDDSLAKNK